MQRGAQTADGGRLYTLCDGYPVPTWRPADIGIIAWSLAHAASTWDSPARLARFSTILPIPAIAGSHSDPFQAPVPDDPGQRFQSNPGSAGVSGDSVTILVG